MADMKTTPTGGAAPESKPKRERDPSKARKTAKLDDFLLGVHRMAMLMADADVFAKHGVTVGEWATLKAMGDKTEVSLRDVTKGAAVSRQRLRTLLNDLEKKGFIKAGRSGDKDKRTRAITVLPKRAEVVAAVAAEFDAMSAKVPSMKGSAKRLIGGLRVADKLASQFRRSAPAEGKGKKGEKGEGKKAKAAKPGREEARAKKKAARAAAKKQKPAA